MISGSLLDHKDGVTDIAQVVKDVDQLRRISL